jgi:glyoxylase-like metal-dependent hydrolase (beta-lactamase superfamily II)
MGATYEVFAIRYAHLERTARHNFLGGDEHDVPMPLDYFVWAIVNSERTILVDTGFDQDAAARRGRQLVRPVADGLRSIGISPDRIEHIVISHMHYDHAGNQELFPRARYHVQDAEMAYCTGRCMANPEVGGLFDADAVIDMIRNVYAGRVQFYDGDAEIAPGISLHKVGGHTRGMQVVRVATARGWVVLGSDTAHFYANLAPGRPFPILDDLPTYIEAQRTALELASSPQHFIPGHDPLVLARYPRARADLDGVARLDLAPRAQGNPG